MKANQKKAGNVTLTILLTLCLGLTVMIAAGWKMPCTESTMAVAATEDSLLPEEIEAFKTPKTVTAKNGDGLMNLGFTLEEALEIAYAERLKIFAIDKKTGEKTAFSAPEATDIDLHKFTVNVVIPIGWTHVAPDDFRSEMLAMTSHGLWLE